MAIQVCVASSTTASTKHGHRHKDAARASPFRKAQRPAEDVAPAQKAGSCAVGNESAKAHDAFCSFKENCAHVVRSAVFVEERGREHTRTRVRGNKRCKIPSKDRSLGRVGGLSSKFSGWRRFEKHPDLSAQNLCPSVRSCPVDERGQIAVLSHAGLTFVPKRQTRTAHALLLYP